MSFLMLKGTQGYVSNTRWSKSLCAPDDYSTKKHAKMQYFKQFQSPTMITKLELGITDGVSVSLVSPLALSINIWRLAGDFEHYL